MKLFWPFSKNWPVLFALDLLVLYAQNYPLVLMKYTLTITANVFWGNTDLGNTCVVTGSKNPHWHEHRYNFLRS